MSRGRGLGGLAALALAGLGLFLAAGPRPSQEWVTVDYSGLVDRRQPSHSGQSIGALLDQLGGRPLPAGPERPEDRLAHELLDPLLEPYAFVLTDALDSLGGAPSGGAAPLVEVGSLWQPGEAQPAWAELLRARRYVVESDGRGRLRVCLPWAGPAEDGTAATAAAEGAWREAWPVLRQVLAAERRRLAAGAAAPPALEVEVHAYRHRAERTAFELGARAARFTVTDTRPDGRRPPLDLAGLERFLAGELLPEGARLDSDGALRWLGSPTSTRPLLVGRPLSAADFAVAYRAVFHGGLAEPYMSLDRGFSPESSIVNYGGRLRDTSLGLVSLLCDARFKTFSQGIDIVSGKDLRERLRQAVPAFETHLERLAHDPQSAGMAGQQTRLWFYPDDVDLTLSLQGDVLVLRRVRMSAASERFAIEEPGAGRGEEPPWTRATVGAINRDYDALVRLFPELGDLDHVVRLLSTFTWLRRAEAEGARVPELDALLGLELPELSTPRVFPQLLAFNALPPQGSRAAVDVYERVDLAEALDRLAPASGRPLPARRRYERALAALDLRNTEQGALLAELRAQDLAPLDDEKLDLASYRAERLMMHQRVLATLEPTRRQAVGARFQRGEQLRVFSVGIGGLDLGMSRALERARGRRLDTGEVAIEPAANREPREAWRAEPAGLPQVVLPEHGLGRARAEPGVVRRLGAQRLELGPASELLVVYGEDGPEPRSRKVVLDSGGHLDGVERFEEGRLLRYRIERQGERLVARLLDGEAPPSPPAPTGEGALPQGLALLEFDDGATPPVDAESREPPQVALRLTGSPSRERRAADLAATVPRPALVRLLLGRKADLTPQQPLAGFAPLPSALGVGEVETLMVLLGAAELLPPWEGGAVPAPGETDPIRVARALREWWAAGDAQPPYDAVVGVDARRSPARWASAPRPAASALLLLPDGAFPPPYGEIPAALRQAWPARRTVATLPERTDATLVVLVSAEPPALCGARLRGLAAAPALEGKLLAAWCMAGPIREDLPATLLAEGRLAGLALAEPSLIARRRAAADLAALATALEKGIARRAEQLPGPFLWYF